MHNIAYKNPATDRAQNAAAVAAYRHPADLIDGELQQQLVAQLAEVLTPVFQFIARGRLGGTMDARSWVVLHETRLDLIRGESIDDFAKRIGVSAQRVHELVKEFRAMVPAYRSPNQKSAVTKHRMSMAQRRLRGSDGKRKNL